MSENVLHVKCSACGQRPTIADGKGVKWCSCGLTSCSSGGLGCAPEPSKIGWRSPEEKAIAAAVADAEERYRKALEPLAAFLEGVSFNLRELARFKAGSNSIEPDPNLRGWNPEAQAMVDKANKAAGFAAELHQARMEAKHGDPLTGKKPDQP